LKLLLIEKTNFHNNFHFISIQFQLTVLSGSVSNKVDQQINP